MFVLIKVFWRSEMARILEISHLSPGLKKKKRKNISCYIGWWWWCSLILVVCLRKYFILFLMCNFLVYRILSQLYFSQHLWCGAMFHVPNFICLPLFHMPNLLSSPFFVLLCLFFLLVTFLWLIVLSHELWCAFVELSYFLYLN